MSLLDRLAGDIDIEEIAKYLHVEYLHSHDPRAEKFSSQLLELKQRMSRGVTPNDIDVETYLAHDIILRVRQVLRAKPEDAVVVRAENVMAQLDVLQAPLREKSAYVRALANDPEHSLRGLATDDAE